VAYFAVALARRAGRWAGDELDLDDVDDVDELAELAREAVEADSPEPTLVFVEEDDEWLGIARVDVEGEPRLFLSDGRTVASSDLADTVFGEIGPSPEDETEDDDDRPSLAAAEPVGDAELLADFGTSAENLLALCAEEGMLPGDVIAALCENAGCLDEFERLRDR
jgi:putative tRNA adenosine deaminase-associated protein